MLYYLPDLKGYFTDISNLIYVKLTSCSSVFSPTHTPHPVVLISAMATEPIIQPKILEVIRNIFPSLPSTFKLLLIFVNVLNSFVMSISLYRCRHQSNIIITQQHHHTTLRGLLNSFFCLWTAVRIITLGCIRWCHSPAYNPCTVSCSF